MSRDLDGDGESQVGESPRSDNGGSSGIGTDDTRGARRAVQRSLEFAQEIVMLERRRREEDGVHRHPGEHEASPPMTGCAAIHLDR